MYRGSPRGHNVRRWWRNGITYYCFHLQSCSWQFCFWSLMFPCYMNVHEFCFNLAMVSDICQRYLKLIPLLCSNVSQMKEIEKEYEGTTAFWEKEGKVRGEGKRKKEKVCNKVQPSALSKAHNTEKPSLENEDGERAHPEVHFDPRESCVDTFLCVLYIGSSGRQWFWLHHITNVKLDNYGFKNN